MNPGGEVEPRDIETFVVLGEELHFGRTADRLHVSPTAISKTIKKLERMVGAKLFERTTHRVDLTPIGRRLYDGVAPAYRQIQACFDDAVLAGRGVEGLLRVGFIGTAPGRFVLQVADAFQAAHPACQVQIEETRFDDWVGKLTGGVIDILMVASPVLDPELAAGPVLFSERRVLAVSACHPLARHASVTMEDLGRDKVLRPRGVPELDEFLVPGETPGGRPIERGPDFATLQEMFALIGAGRGIFPIPQHYARYDARPDVACIPIDDGPRLEWRLLWRKAAETNRIRAFSQMAEDRMRQTGTFLL